MHMVLGPENQGDAIVLVIYDFDGCGSYTITYHRNTDSIKVRWASWGAGAESLYPTKGGLWTVLALDNPLYKWGEEFLKGFAFKHAQHLSNADMNAIDEFLLQVETARVMG